METVSRRKKNNVILVGEPGVGKTAIAEGLAKKIVDGDVLNLLAKDKEIWSIDITSMVTVQSIEVISKNVLSMLLTPW